MNKKRLCILLCLCVLFIITADASDSQLNMNGRKLVLHQKFEYENGKLTHSAEYEYDSHGREIKAINSYYSSDGSKILNDTDLEHDENDNIIRAHTSYSYSGADSYCEYQYDSHGNKLQTTFYWDGKITQTNYEYDMHENLLLMTETQKYENDPDCRLTEQKRYTYTYDTQGNLTQMTVTTDDYDYSNQHSQYTYTHMNTIRRAI